MDEKADANDLPGWAIRGNWVVLAVGRDASDWPLARAPIESVDSTVPIHIDN